MPTKPSRQHNYAGVAIITGLEIWNRETGIGPVNLDPGLTFAEDVGVSNARRDVALKEDVSYTPLPNWSWRFFLRVAQPNGAIVQRN